MMEVKGTAIKDYTKFVKENYGEDEFQKWFDALPPESQKIYSKQILPSLWYPMKAASLDPLRKMTELFWGGDPKNAEIYGKYIADNTLTGIYKAFVKLGSPSFIISKTSAIFGTFIRPAKLESIEKTNNHYVYRISDYPEMTEETEYVFTGFSKRAIELCGAKNVTVKINASLVRGDAFTEIECSWE